MSVDSDPNTTPPTELHTFGSPIGKDTDPSALYVAPVGGAVTVQLWAYFGGLKRWMKLGAATACDVDTVTSVVTVPVGIGTLFLQVTVNTACTGFAAGYVGAR